jgi:hypothetical protein
MLGQHTTEKAPAALHPAYVLGISIAVSGTAADQAMAENANMVLNLMYCISKAVVDESDKSSREEVMCRYLWWE